MQQARATLKGRLSAFASYVVNGNSTHVLRFRTIGMRLPGMSPLIDLNVAVHANYVQHRRDHALLATLQVGDSVELDAEFAVESADYAEVTRLHRVAVSSG